MVVLIIHLSLAVIEDPSSLHDFTSVSYGDGIEEVDSIQIFLMELVCLAFYTLDLYYEQKLWGRYQFRRSKWVRTKVILLVLTFVNICLFQIDNSIPRLTRPFRPVFFIERFRNVRKIFSSILRSLPKFIYVRKNTHNYTHILC